LPGESNEGATYWLLGFDPVPYRPPEFYLRLGPNICADAAVVPMINNAKIGTVLM
jgi:hypothetical protein